MFGCNVLLQLSTLEEGTTKQKGKLWAHKRGDVIAPMVMLHMNYVQVVRRDPC